MAEFDDEDFERWERDVNKQLEGLSVLEEDEGTEDEAVADLTKQFEARGMTIDDAEARRIVREARDQHQDRP
jgi:hypothetical protein